MHRRVFTSDPMTHTYPGPALTKSQIPLR